MRLALANSPVSGGCSVDSSERRIIMAQENLSSPYWAGSPAGFPDLCRFSESDQRIMASISTGTPSCSRRTFGIISEYWEAASVWIGTTTLGFNLCTSSTRSSG
jgi:hypothetical protein